MRNVTHVFHAGKYYDPKPSPYRGHVIRLGILAFSAFGFLGAVAAQTTHPVEAFPDTLQARIEARNRFASAIRPQAGGSAPFFVLRSLALWPPGQALRVAFYGGNVALYADIASAAKEWLTYGNAKLDFGLDGNRRYREWSPADTQYSAEIRISFDQPGYWSMVGRDSMDPGLVGPNQASMNFGLLQVSRPPDWRTIVLHEFGHAFGFEHEHQNPVGGCDGDFRWYDDTGYIPTTIHTTAGEQYVPDTAHRRPGLYTFLGGAPNFWPAAKVDFNLRQFQNSSAFMTSGYDGQSIMKYFFDPSMFAAGTQSHCYSAENIDLSARDKAGFAASYPTNG